MLYYTQEIMYQVIRSNWDMREEMIEKLKAKKASEEIEKKQITEFIEKMKKMRSVEPLSHLGIQKTYEEKHKGYSINGKVVFPFKDETSLDNTLTKLLEFKDDSQIFQK